MAILRTAPAALLAALTVLLLAAAAPVFAAEPWVVVHEEEGHLRFLSRLSPGRHELPRSDEAHARGIEGDVEVAEGPGPLRPVSALHVEFWGPKLSVTGVSDDPFADAEQARPGFEASLSAYGDRFRFELESVEIDGEGYHQRMATLRRGLTGYSLFFGTNQVVGQTERGENVVELMLEHPLLYQAFEETAAQCSHGRFQLVPQSRYSPSVLKRVMGPRIRPSLPVDREEWRQLIDDLDHDRYYIRDAAVRDLLATGEKIIGYLKELDPKKLSVEQRLNIRYILRAFSADVATQPEPLERAELIRLQTDPPLSWLITLLVATDPNVRGWAQDRLNEYGVEVALPADAGIDERRAYREKLLGKPASGR